MTAGDTLRIIARMRAKAIERFCTMWDTRSSPDVRFQARGTIGVRQGVVAALLFMKREKEG